jgi:hypothetical protein
LGHFQLIFGFIFGSFLVVWLKNDQNGPKIEVKNDVKNGYRECSETFRRQEPNYDPFMHIYRNTRLGK